MVWWTFCPLFVLFGCSDWSGVVSSRREGAKGKKSPTKWVYRNKSWDSSHCYLTPGMERITRVWQTADCSPKCILLFLHNEGVLARHKVTHQETTRLRLLTVGKWPTSCQENVNRSDEFSSRITFVKGNCLPFVSSLCLSPWPGQPNFNHAYKDYTLRRGNKMEQTLYAADFPINLDRSPLNCYMRKEQYSILLLVFECLSYTTV